MPAPKGNKNAKKPGYENKFRIRTKTKDDLSMVALLTPEQRAIAIEGYVLWLESPESESDPFVGWVKNKIGEWWEPQVRK